MWYTRVRIGDGFLHQYTLPLPDHQGTNLSLSIAGHPAEVLDGNRLVATTISVMLTPSTKQRMLLHFIQMFLKWIISAAEAPTKFPLKFLASGVRRLNVVLVPAGVGVPHSPHLSSCTFACHLRISSCTLTGGRGWRFSLSAAAAASQAAMMTKLSLSSSWIDR